MPAAPRPAVRLAAAALPRRFAGAALAVLALTAGGAGAGCASSLFGDYPDHAYPGVHDFEQGRFAEAAGEFAELRGTWDSTVFLAHAEAGMALHVGGDLDGAIEHWLQAAEILDSFGDRPTISGRSATEGTMSMVVNDKTIPYDGEGFEAALLHGFLAWDFLRLGDLDGAMVEVKRGYEMEQFEEERYGTTYGMNRFARFVAAVAQEMDGAYDEAQIDLERLAEEVPEHPAVQYSLERIRKLQSTGRREAAGQAELIVVLERGRMPEKEAREVVFQTRRSLGRLSLPAFGHVPLAGGPAVAEVDGQEVGRTHSLESVLTVARKNLEDRILWVTSKAIARAALKTAAVDRVAEEVADEHGDLAGLLAGIAGSVAQFATERADLRSWLTLPADLQVLRVPVEPGRHRVRLRVAAGEGGWVDAGIHQFRPGVPVMIGARSLRGRLHVSAPGGVAAEAGDATDTITP